MIYQDLTKALDDLGWKYKDFQLTMIFESVSLFNIDYDRAIRIGIKYDRKPTPRKLIEGLRELVKDSDKEDKRLFVCISLDVEEEYYKEALETSIRYGFIMPSITSTYENLEKYCKMAVGLPPQLYELAWVYLYAQGFSGDMPTPEKCTMPELWENYGIYTE